MAQLAFNANNVAPDQGRPDPVPGGWYTVAAEESEIKPTKDGTGAYVSFRFNILEGDFTGQKLFTRFNIQNANPVAVEIGYGQLSAMLHAVGVLDMQDTSQVHGIPFKVKAVIKPASGEYAEQNEVNTYKHVSEQTPPSPTKADQAALVAGKPTAAPAAQPWQPQAQPQAAPQQTWQPPAQAQPQPVQQTWQPPAQPQAQPVQQTAQPQGTPQQAPQGTPLQPWQQPAQQTAQPAQQPAQQTWQQTAQQPAQQPAQQAPQQTAQEPVQQPVQQTAQPAPQQGAETPPWLQNQPQA